MQVIDFTNTIKSMADSNGFDATVKVKSREDSGTVVIIIVEKTLSLFEKKTAQFITPADSDFSTVTRMFENWISHLQKYGVPA